MDNDHNISNWIETLRAWLREILATPLQKTNVTKNKN